MFLIDVRARAHRGRRGAPARHPDRRGRRHELRSRRHRLRDPRQRRRDRARSASTAGQVADACIDGAQRFNDARHAPRPMAAATERRDGGEATRRHGPRRGRDQAAAAPRPRRAPRRTRTRAGPTVDERRPRRSRTRKRGDAPRRVVRLRLASGERAELRQNWRRPICAQDRGDRAVAEISAASR